MKHGCHRWNEFLVERRSLLGQSPRGGYLYDHVLKGLGLGLVPAKMGPLRQSEKSGSTGTPTRVWPGRENLSTKNSFQRWQPCSTEKGVREDQLVEHSSTVRSEGSFLTEFLQPYSFVFGLVWNDVQVAQIDTKFYNLALIRCGYDGSISPGGRSSGLRGYFILNLEIWPLPLVYKDSAKVPRKQLSSWTPFQRSWK